MLLSLMPTSLFAARMHRLDDVRNRRASLYSSISVTSGSRAHLQGPGENGTVQMPLQETFWAFRFGVLVDQFGIPWQINCGKPA
jgi:uncharacterized glyoxalase superfamily protein PhnB